MAKKKSAADSSPTSAQTNRRKRSAKSSGSAKQDKPLNPASIEGLSSSAENDEIVTQPRVLPTSTIVMFARADYALREMMPQLIHDPRVHFVDVGYKITGGKRQSELAIRVHVFQKTDANPIPHTCCNGGICTDVIRSQFKEAASSGDGIESPLAGRGTLSLVVEMNDLAGLPDRVRLKYLTCAHVVTNTNPQPFTDISHLPTRNLLGQLVGTGPNFFQLDEEIDVAIFDSINRITSGSFANFPSIFRPTSIGEVTKSCVASELRVFKIGNASGETIGLIDCQKPIFRDITINNGVNTKDHFLVSSINGMPAFATDGDSGSAVVSERGELLGIVRGLTTADSDGPRTVVTPISSIVAKMRIQVVV